MVGCNKGHVLGEREGEKGTKTVRSEWTLLSELKRAAKVRI